MKELLAWLREAQADASARARNASEAALLFPEDQHRRVEAIREWAKLDTLACVAEIVEGEIREER